MATAVAMREAWAATLVELAPKFPDLLVLDGDLANSTRAEVFEAAFPDRFLEMGIAEQNLAGVAAGLATVGFVPWLSSFAVFLVNRDLDQIRQVIAQPGLNVKIAGHYSGLFTARTGKTHQEVSDISVMRAMPNMTVVAPADAVECRSAMGVLMETPGPAYLRLTRDPSPVVFGDDYQFQLGKLVTLREGRDLTIIGTGVQSIRALEAADILAREGVEAHVVHAPTIKPIDPEGVVAAAARTGLVLTTEEHTVLGGLGGLVAEILGQRYPVRMRIHGLQDCYGESGANNDLLEKYGLTPRHIAEAARTLLHEARTATSTVR